MALMKRGLADSEADSEASKRAKTDDIGKIVPPGCNIFIYHAPLTWDDSTLNAIFGAYGKIVSATIMKHKNTGLSKGFGFVGYDKPQSAAAAIEAMNGFEISGKRLKVQLKSEGKVGLGGGITAVSTPAGVQGGATEHGPAGCNLFIYYCPDRWDDEELKLAFTAYGNVTSATIMKNRETGLSKCFGFVTFDNPIAAQQAIQGLNGFEVEGKRLKVELKQNKTKGMPQAGQLNQLLGLFGGGMGGGQLQLGGLGGIGVQNPNLFLGGLGGLSGQNQNLLAAQQQLLMKQQLEQQVRRTNESCNKTTKMKTPANLGV